MLRNNKEINVNDMESVRGKVTRDGTDRSGPSLGEVTVLAYLRGLVTKHRDWVTFKSCFWLRSAKGWERN